MLDNFSNDYSQQGAFIKEPEVVEENNYSSQQSLSRSLLNNKLISFCIILSLLVFFGVVIGEKNKIFSRFIPRLRGEIALPNNLVITSIENKFPILIRQNDPHIADQLRYRGTVKTIFDDAALTLCSKGANVVEVGAHYGYNSIMLGQVLRMDGKYIAIEGNPSVARCLYKNIILNDLSDTVEIIRKAVSDHKGTCSIDDVVSAVQNDEGASSITGSVTVECDSLDQILQDKEVSLILVNVPKSAFAVLNGASRIISETDNLQLLVNLDLDKVDSSVNVRKELSSLHQQGLRFYEVDSTTDVKEVFIDEIINKKQLVVLMKKEK